MQYFKSIEKKLGCDVGFHSSNLHPTDKEGCVGKAGIDKSYTLDMVINLAYKIPNKPNIIIKPGPNAKWYMKQIPLHNIDQATETQKWRNTSHCIMYIIVWD